MISSRHRWGTARSTGQRLSQQGRRQGRAWHRASGHQQPSRTGHHRLQRSIHLPKKCNNINLEFILRRKIRVIHITRTRNYPIEFLNFYFKITQPCTNEKSLKNSSMASNKDL